MGEVPELYPPVRTIRSGETSAAPRHTVVVAAFPRTCHYSTAEARGHPVDQVGHEPGARSHAGVEGFGSAPGGASLCRWTDRLAQSALTAGLSCVTA